MRHDIEGYKFVPGGRKRVHLTESVALLNATFHIGSKSFYGVVWVNEDNQGDIEKIAFFVGDTVVYDKHPNLLKLLGVTRKEYKQKRYIFTAVYAENNYHLVAGKPYSIKISNYKERYRSYNTHGLNHFESWTGVWNKHNPKHVKEVIRRFHAGLIDFNRCMNKEYEILVENGIKEAV